MTPPSLLPYCLLAFSLAFIPFAQAQQPAPVAVESRVLFNIPAQPLAAAINSFARQSGWQVSLRAALATSLQSAAVQGHYSPQEALNLLLQDSALRWQSNDARSVLIYADETQPISLGPVRVQGANSPKDEAYRAPGSVNVITRDDIERFRGTSVGDIFQGTAGVLVGENRNSGGLDVNIRGMQGQGRVPVLVDGARQETTVYRGYAGVASRSYVDPDLIGSVRIEKGPVMTAEGTGATGGVVNVSTINAEDIIKPGNTFGIRLRGSLIGNNNGTHASPGTPSGYNLGGKGEFRTDCSLASLCSGDYDLANAAAPMNSSRPELLELKSWSGSIATAWQFDAVNLVAAYARRIQGNYYAGSHGPTPSLDLSNTDTTPGFYTIIRPEIIGATRFRANELIVNSNYESESLLLKSQFFLNNEHELEVGYQRYSSIYGEMMPSQLLWLGQIRQTKNSDVTVNTYTSRWQWNPATYDLLNITARLWHTNTDSLNINYSEDSTNELFGSGIENYQRWGFDISNQSDFFFSSGNLTWNYGISIQREEVDGNREATISFVGSGRKGHRNELSAFTSLQYQPTENLTIDAGIRYSRFKSEDDKPVYPAQGSTYCVDTNADGSCEPLMMNSEASGSAPLLSISYDLWNGIQVYARYAEALRMPSLFETTSGQSVSPSQDIHLKPEHTKNREVGINLLRSDFWFDNDKLGVKFAIFQNHTDDYLTRTLPNSWEDGALSEFTLRNINSVSFHGAEISGRYDAGRFFTEFSGTGYTHIETCHFGSYRRIECTDYGISTSYVNNMIPPKWHASLTLGTRVFDQKLELGIRGTFMGKRTPTPRYNNQTTSGGFAEPVPWHEYTLWDVFASYRVNNHLNIDFNIDNVTDQYYLDALSLGLVPAPGRSARLSATLRF